MMASMKTILIVGINDRRRSVLENFISFEGFAEIVTDDLWEAIEAALAGRADLILWDARLADWGRDILRRDLRHAEVDVPVITLDADEIIRRRRPRRSTDLEECLVNPFDTETLSLVMRSIFQRRSSDLPLAS